MNEELKHMVDAGVGTERPRVVVTGADGFLGWHTRVRLRALWDADVVAVDRSAFLLGGLDDAVRGADAVIHAAGVLRGSDYEVEHGNIALAQTVVDAMDRTGSQADVVFANSVHAGTASAYGRGKRGAAAVLASWGQRAGCPVADVHLTNLFGEHGRPNYNSFVATFAHQVAAGTAPSVSGDRPIVLQHVQDAAAALLDAWQAPTSGVVRPGGDELLISEVRDRLVAFHQWYRNGDIPTLVSAFDVSLFNTLRAAMFPEAYPFMPTPRSDARGTLVESVRVHGGQGQTFVSSTNPGYTRGEHFHLHKIERFQVLSGEAVIRLRKVLTDEVVQFKVSGDEPAVVDMPTMWAHSIENVGDGELVTLFWAHELFDAAHPDTYPEPVLSALEPVLSASEPVLSASEPALSVARS
jgi:UDP-2-acetamido-2,6-beta-L-arabino-hexul-4-ose reductase